MSQEIERIECEWAEIQELPLSMYGGCCVVHEHKIYLFSGSANSNYTNRMWLLDLQAKNCEWEEIHYNSEVIPKERVDGTASVYKNKMYVCCGWSAEYLSDFWSFDFSKREWERLADVPIKVTSGRSSVEGDALYFHGGYNSGLEPKHSNKIFKFDFLTKEWSEVKTSPLESGEDDKRTAHCFFVHKKNFYIFGGYYELGGKVKFLKYISPHEKWIVLNSSPYKEIIEVKEGRDCAGCKEGDLFFEYGPANKRGEVWLYDLSKDVWKILSLKQKNEYILTRSCHSMVYHQGDVYIIGGSYKNCYVVHTYEKGKWNKDNHQNYPLSFKKQVFCLLSIYKVDKNKIPVPRVILHYILQFLSLYA